MMTLGPFPGNGELVWPFAALFDVGIIVVLKLVVFGT